MNAHFVARRAQDRTGRRTGWNVYRLADGGGRHFATYTGSFAWWRAHWQAASMNHAMSRRPA